MSLAGQRWRQTHPSPASELDLLVRAALADEVVADLLHARSVDVRTSRESSVAWACGIFEGEGSWGCYRSKLSATIVMGDRDVLERFCAIVGVGGVSASPSHTGNPKHKLMWRWSASNSAVIELALLFWPHLGERRRQTFCAKLTKREQFVQLATQERACAGCDQIFRPPYSRMASRTRYCSDTCRQRASRAR